MLQQTIKGIIKKLLPQRVLIKFNSISNRKKIKQVQLNHQKALRAIKGKAKIKVAFFLIHRSVWKYEGVYRLMENDDRFEPIVIVCPYISMGESTMIEEMNETYDDFKKKKYNVIKALKDESGNWLDVKKEIKPDIVCFTNQWNITKPQYYIYNFLDTLTCYVPYAFKNSHLYEHHFNGPMQKYVWKFFLETEIHKELSIKHSENKSSNALVTGYPGMDKLLQENYRPEDVWKIKNKHIKRIIWAPHHTIKGMGATLDFSTFLLYAEFMLDLGTKFRDQIQIAFKPHPLLKAKLSKEEVWGIAKTDKYYKKWHELPNGHLFEGEYIDLFLTSDALIHDGSSFLIEYLYVNKPALYLLHDSFVNERLNEVGKLALSTHYQAKNEKELEQFINNVIIEGKDPKQNERFQLFNSIIRPPNNRTASENIFYSLKQTIFT